jgi:hypothetical protein
MSTHIIVAIMGGLLLFVITQIRAKYKRLSAGEMVIGHVSGFETVTGKKAPGQTPVIKFTTLSNVAVEKRSDDSILSARIKKGTKVKVFYDPQKPEDFIAQSMQFKVTTMVVLVASTIFTLFGLLLILNDVGLIHLLKQ